MNYDRSCEACIHGDGVREHTCDRVTESIRLTQITQTCRACPSQWNAVDDRTGSPLYIRYRYGRLTVQNDNDGTYLLDEQLGDGLDGVMSTASMSWNVQLNRAGLEKPVKP